MIKELNNFGKNRTPIIFIIDYEMKSPIIVPFDQAKKEDIYFNIAGIKNYNNDLPLKKEIQLKKKPISYSRYNEAFKKIKRQLELGNSYLINLTFPTHIEINLSLREIFFSSKAKYKLLYKNDFVVFSPEQFVIIKNNQISSYPMKGTINASIPNAKDIILANEKEFAEHITIVDLIRNDLGIVSKNIRVDNFRYIDEIKTHESKLLQVSSKITGSLENNWNEKLGDIIYNLLPAGSITGAPKKKTVEIIKDIENYERGYYTGIFGYFDGYEVNSAVMIRFIERNNDKYIYKSGGGITIYSDPEYEYNELVDKVYVPIS